MSDFCRATKEKVLTMENLLPPLPPDSLSAADVFGAASELALRSGAAHAAAAGAGDAVLQVAALAVALFYIYTAVRYSGIVCAIVLSAAGVAPSRRGGQRHINSSLRRNVEVAIAASGFVAAAVAAVRLFGQRMAESGLPTGAAVAAAAVIAAFAALVVFEYAAVRSVGFVGGRNDLSMEILRLKLRHFSAAAAAMLPVGMLCFFAAPDVAEACFYLLGVQCFVSAILFAKETFSLFLSQRISILYWILYLCTLEIFPVSLLLAPLLRAGSGF